MHLIIKVARCAFACKIHNSVFKNFYYEKVRLLDINPDISLLVDKLTPYQLSQALDISIDDATALIDGVLTIDDLDDNTSRLLIDLNDKLKS